MKLEVGKTIDDFKFCTQNGCKESFVKELKKEKTVLLFLRYIGCPPCNLTVLEINENLDKFKEKNMDIYVVLQSEVDVLNEAIEGKDIEFEIICDPNMELYRKFSLGEASSPHEMRGEGTQERIQASIDRGLEHGKYEGNEMQFPATFIVDDKGIILYSKYGQHVTDYPLVNELLSF